MKFIKTYLKKYDHKNFSKVLCSILVFALMIFLSGKVSISASGINYGTNTTFHFDINDNYLEWFENADFPTSFSYICQLPLEFTNSTGEYTFSQLTFIITSGNLTDITCEGLTNLGMPYTLYFLSSGGWNMEDILVREMINNGILVDSVYVNDMYNFNFMYNTPNSFDNYILRWFRYSIINEFLRIKLDSYRFNKDFDEVFINPDKLSILENISQVYVPDSEDSYRIIGLTLGGNLFENEVEIILNNLKFAYSSYDYSFNYLTLYNDYGSGSNDTYMFFNEVEVYNTENTSSWVNDRYHYLTLYDAIGIMDYLNLTMYGKFNVMPYASGFDENSTFGDLFTGIANIPIVILSNLLSFSVFGWTAFAIFCSIITLLVIFWLIKKLTGGGN